MGVSGDMLLGALYELMPQADDFLHRLNALGLPGVKFAAQKVQRCGISSTHMQVLVHNHEEHELLHKHDHNQAHKHSHHHDHHTLTDIYAIIDALHCPDTVKEQTKSVYQLLAQAESAAHGTDIATVHLHEVGMLDDIADICGVCLALYLLQPQRIIVSPIRTGYGHVRCAHGILPIPAPATLYLLNGLPTYSGDIEGELCTPTGAALLRHFATEFGHQPLLQISKTGYGAGSKDLPQANCIRIMLSHPQQKDCSTIINNDTDTPPAQTDAQPVDELICNVDDMSGEDIGLACRRLMDAGALDVCLLPVQMKKFRPGYLLICICRPEHSDTLAAAILRYTSSLGLRRHRCRRYTLQRDFSEYETPYGSVRIKHAHGFGIEKSKVEHDDISKIALNHDLAFSELKDLP